MGTPVVLEYIRRFGPFGILLYCLIILFTSAGERAIYFTPTEVDFLFPAPFSRRALLWYKVGGQLLNVVAQLTILMTAISFKNVASPIAAFVGVFLTLAFPATLFRRRDVGWQHGGRMGARSGRVRSFWPVILVAVVTGIGPDRPRSHGLGAVANRRSARSRVSPIVQVDSSRLCDGTYWRLRPSISGPISFSGVCSLWE